MTYSKLRGKCKEMSEELIKNNPKLELVRGYYFCPIWNTEEQHWWCRDKETKLIIDPTKDQFPSKGVGIYAEFDGVLKCEQCGKEFLEEHMGFAGNYPVCSDICHGALIGVSLGGSWSGNFFGDIKVEPYEGK